MKKNMHTYASICRAVNAAKICKLYANYMQVICKNMQNMQLRFAYAKYAKICTPHFADNQSQNPTKNFNYKAPDIESKQRFSEDSEWSTLGAPKMP